MLLKQYYKDEIIYNLKYIKYIPLLFPQISYNGPKVIFIYLSTDKILNFLHTERKFYMLNSILSDF